jgi:predicted ester cyclase
MSMKRAANSKKASGVKRGATVKRGTVVKRGVAAKRAVVMKRTATVVPLERRQNAVDKRLKIFDELDYEVFSGQKWDRLQESHARDIIVTWPDGHETTGIEKHIDDLKAMFVYAPDTSIKVHPIRFGAGEWTCVAGVMTGTFSKPMPTGDGKEIPPTGKPFSLTMTTIGHWKGSVMDHEWLFWDNHEFMRQIGLG